MLIPIHILKVAQASAVLLKTEQDRRMSRLRLLKLLYIADRESLAERARPITGDRPVAMDHGPVLSRTYDAIKGADYDSRDWDRYLASPGRDVLLVNDPGVGKLTPYEIRKLQDVACRWANVNDWDVAEYTHGFEEWRKNQPAKGGSKPIPIDDLLAATGRADIKDKLLAEGAAATLADRIFSSAATGTD